MKFMLVEENGDERLGEIIDDGRWVPSATPLNGNILSGRHRLRSGSRVSAQTFLNKGLCTIGYVDGHVDVVTPAAGHKPDNFDPMR